MLDEAIFRDTSRESSESDRSSRDRQRHRKKIREAMRGKLPEIIAEESIIGRDKGKIIKVPIRGIKEYRFVYGSNGPGAGQAQGEGDPKPGDVIGKRDSKGLGQRDKLGDQPGVDYYETDVTLEELTEMLFEELELPDMEKKALRVMFAERDSRHKGYRHIGIPARLSKKRTAIEHTKRKMASGFTEFAKEFPESLNDEEYQGFKNLYADFPDILYQIESWYFPDNEHPGRWVLRFAFSEKDTRFNHMKPDIVTESNAVVVCIMDTSGSMDTMKKYIARVFFFLLYRFVITKYRMVEIVFVAHHTEGREVTEEEFFHKGESGGTFISSGYERALEIIADRYNRELWNIYAFHCSDGDNFESDNPKAITLAGKLCEIANLFGYGEIKPVGTRTYESSMINIFSNALKKFNNYHACMIEKPEDIWSVFKEFMTHDSKKGE